MSDDTIRALRALGKIISQEQIDDIVMDLDCEHDSECDYAQYCVLIDKVQNKGVTRRELQEASVFAVDSIVVLSAWYHF